MRLQLACNAAGDIRVRCLRDVKERRAVPAVSDALLVCSDLFQEMTTPVKNLVRKGFGCISDRNNFTRYAKGLVREVGALLDTGPLRNLVFLTGTLPGSTDEAQAALAAWSGWVVQTVCQWLRDTVETPQFFGVWEYQKRGALHVHLCCRVQSEQEAAKLKQLWKGRWLKVLDGVGHRSGVDMYARRDGGTWADTKWVTKTDAQTVEKSVARYLGKYLSKGSTAKRAQCEYPPSAWYFCPRSLRSSARESRRVLTVERLNLETVCDVFERVGSFVAMSCQRLCSYVSRYDFTVKGLIALGQPVQARLLFEALSGVLRVVDAPLSPDGALGLKGAAAATVIFEVLPRGNIQGSYS